MLLQGGEGCCIRRGLCDVCCRIFRYRICIYIYTYIHIYICVHIHTYVNIHLHTYIYIYRHPLPDGMGTLIDMEHHRALRTHPEKQPGHEEGVKMCKSVH